ncbi:MAG: peptidase C39 family protein [Nocardioides sp.]|nr:peptidase C39 family protein [Nocardioides sp.]
MVSRTVAATAAGILVGSLFATLQAGPAGAEPDRAGPNGHRDGARNGSVHRQAPRPIGPRRTRTNRWTSNADLARGTNGGVKVGHGALRIRRPKGTRTVPDPFGAKGNRRFEWSRWTAPWQNTGFNATNLIASWNARTPGRTFVRIEARTRTGRTTSSWDKIADWGTSVSAIHRTSGSAQTDDLNKLQTDTLVSSGAPIRGYQLRVTLFRPSGRSISPSLRSVGAVAATYTTRTQPVSKTTMRKNTALPVPRFSQMIHTGHYPQWGDGGQAWCSPTSTAMVLRHFHRGPRPAAYAWTHETYGEVDYAARFTYDHRYEGNGNWPFNTAYAGHFGMDAYVTRLRNLRDAERFIRAGIPVVISLAFDKGELDGAPINSTNGHLMVIVGFRKNGDVVANDPAAPKNSTVRRVYKRAQLEKAWLGASGGVTYVIHPPGKALPKKTNRW